MLWLNPTPPSTAPATSPTSSALTSTKAWTVPALLWLFGSILIASAVARLLSMAFPPAGASTDPESFAAQSAFYIEQGWAPILHLGCGLVFAIFGPLQFSARLRTRAPRAHRMMGYAFVTSTLFIGASGLWMNVVFPPVGGALKLSANWVFGVAMLLAVVLAMRAIFRRDFVGHRAWMMRTFAIGMGVATQRWVLLPIFVALGEFDDVLIGVGVWGGWLLNVVVVEVLIRGRLRGLGRLRAA